MKIIGISTTLLTLGLLALQVYNAYERSKGQDGQPVIMGQSVYNQLTPEQRIMVDNWQKYLSEQVGFTVTLDQAFAKMVEFIEKKQFAKA